MQVEAEQRKNMAASLQRIASDLKQVWGHGAVMADGQVRAENAAIAAQLAS